MCIETAIFTVFLVGVVAAVCKKMNIPHFVGYWQAIDTENFNSTDSFTRNLFPHPKLFSKSLLEVIVSFRWKYFAVIYDDDDALIRLQDIFSMNTRPGMMNKQTVKFYKLPSDSDDFKPVLKEISKSTVNQVMLDCSLKNTYSVLQQSVDVGMMSEYLSYLIASTDGYTIDLSPLKNLNANITTFRLMNPNTVEAMNAVYEFHIGNRFAKYSSNQLTVKKTITIHMQRTVLIVFVCDFRRRSP